MPSTLSLTALIKQGHEIPHHRPWLRAVVTEEAWRAAVQRLAAQDLALLGLCGDKNSVHMAVFYEAAGEVGVGSLACADGWVPSVAQNHPPALHLEAAV